MLSLTAKLAFGKTISVPSVPTTGISKITAVDFEYAKILRSTIKLLGTAVLAEKDDGSKALSVFVSPTMVPLSSPLASAKGPGNMVIRFSLLLYMANNFVISHVSFLVAGAHQQRKYGRKYPRGTWCGSVSYRQLCAQRHRPTGPEPYLRTIPVERQCFLDDGQQLQVKVLCAH